MQNDPTVERCERRARTLGYGAFRVCNIFAWRETNPAKMRRTDEPVGAANDAAIVEGCDWAHAIVCAWGSHGEQCISLAGGGGSEINEWLGAALGTWVFLHFVGPDSILCASF